MRQNLNILILSIVILSSVLVSGMASVFLQMAAGSLAVCSLAIVCSLAGYPIGEYHVRHQNPGRRSGMIP